jgi:hypothetical protein
LLFTGEELKEFSRLWLLMKKSSGSLLKFNDFEVSLKASRFSGVRVL